MKTTVITLKEMKTRGEKIAVLTAYDCPTARIMDECGVDCILVGDSVGNVLLGFDNTIPVTVGDMIHHGKAVCRGVKNALVIIDMPFMSYQISPEDAVRNAGRIVKETGCNAVKLEGGAEAVRAITAITAAGIPVCGHVGLTPQSVNALGGYRVQGKGEAAAEELLSAAKSVEAAGAFAIVLECVPAELAHSITKTLTIPTIGIGAGAFTDGQVLVGQDILGFAEKPAKFVKQYADVASAMKEAFLRYKDEVKGGEFPDEQRSF
ncbi:3-methyl-2-oxobutanoate hydroxymethyltransferase [Clostridia bacterium]|nr:3-methyl-2-oxobutanoate hydroxymethyltransferase [Clostridia bacterium]